MQSSRFVALLIVTQLEKLELLQLFIFKFNLIPAAIGTPLLMQIHCTKTDLLLLKVREHGIARSISELFRVGIDGNQFGRWSDRASYLVEGEGLTGH